MTSSPAGRWTWHGPRMPAYSHRRRTVPGPSGFGPNAVTSTPAGRNVQALLRGGQSSGRVRPPTPASSGYRASSEGVMRRRLRLVAVERPQTHARRPGALVPEAEVRGPLIVEQVDVDAIGLRGTKSCEYFQQPGVSEAHQRRCRAGRCRRRGPGGSVTVRPVLRPKMWRLAPAHDVVGRVDDRRRAGRGGTAASRPSPAGRSSRPPASGRPACRGG